MDKFDGYVVLYRTEKAWYRARPHVFISKASAQAAADLMLENGTAVRARVVPVELDGDL